jgi:hypothetical protein
VAAQLQADRAQSRTAEDELRSELKALKLSALSKRAAAAGVSRDAIEAAVDSDSPKESFVALLLEAESGAGGRDSAALELQAELEGLRVSALRRRAEDAGVGPEQIDNAMDGAAPKEDLISLLLRPELTTGQKVRWPLTRKFSYMSTV